MTHIELYGKPKSGRRIIINGVDYTRSIYSDVELVEVGEGETAEVGFRVTFAVNRLDLNADLDVRVTDNFRPVAQRVRTMQEVDK